MEVFTLDTPLVKKFTDTGYQHISLCNGEGKKIIPFNPQKKDFQKKITEIRARLNLLPDGLYQALLNWNYGGAGAPDVFLIKKGNAPVENIPAQPPTRQIVSLKERQTENVLSYDKALENVQKIADLEARNRELSAEVKRLEIEIEVLEEELQTGAPLSEGQTPDVSNWLKDIAPILSPLADEYFKTENRKLAIQEREQFFKYGGGKKQPAKIVNREGRQVKHSFPDLNNEEEINGYLDALEKLDEDKFLQVCKMLQTENPALYEIVEAEFSEQPGNENETPE